MSRHISLFPGSLIFLTTYCELRLVTASAVAEAGGAVSERSRHHNTHVRWACTVHWVYVLRIRLTALIPHSKCE